VIELAMVLILIGIMATLILPKIRLESSGVDSAVRTVNMTLMVAQREAVSRQHNVIVVIDTAKHMARTVWDANNTGLTESGERTRPFLLPDNVVVGRPSGVPAMGGSAEDVATAALTQSGDPQVIMLRSGAANRAAILYFTSMRAMAGGPDKDVRAVSVSRATGRPTWYVWTGSRWRRG
jgi:type II secretory pathway pseudopilin PulG